MVMWIISIVNCFFYIYGIGDVVLYAMGIIAVKMKGPISSILLTIFVAMYSINVMALISVAIWLLIVTCQVSTFAGHAPMGSSDLLAFDIFSVTWLWVMCL